MATALKIKSDIKKLKAAINSKATPKSFLPKLNAQLEKAENELKTIQSGGVKKASTTTNTQKTLTALQKLVNTTKKYAIYRGHSVDLKKDSGEGAMKIGYRVSKGLTGNQYVSKNDAKGRVYYEYRPNRLDVKQPKKAQTYPKLEEGGMMEGQMSIFENSQMMAKGGKLSIEKFKKKYDKNEDNNMHSENVLLLAENFGTEQDVKDAKRILTLHNTIGSLPAYLSEERNALSKKLWKKYMDAANGDGKMAKGGRTRVIRGFSDDEEYEYGDGGLTAYADNNYDYNIGTFKSLLEAKKFAKANKWKYDTIIFQDENGDSIEVSKGDTFKDIDWLFSNQMADGRMMEKGGQINVVTNEGYGKVINELYNQWNDVKNDAQYEKWVQKVKETKFGTYGTISFSQVLDKFEFEKSTAINDIQKRGFKQELLQVANKMADGGMMAKGGKPRVTRGFSDDEEYEYGNGGNTSYNSHGEMHRNEQ